MKLKARIGLVVIFTIMVSFTFMVALAAESQTVHIVDNNDDGYMTEAGLGLDGPLVVLLDPNMDIRSYLVFEDIEINTWEYLTNATLRLTSSQTLDFDNDSSVTVYGMRQSDLGGILTDTTHLSPQEVWSMPLTSASVDVNTSQFQGGATIDINVTNIVNEIIRDPHWDGHGLSGADDGDDLGFIILGAPDEGRFFYDYSGDPARSADLILHWGSTPPGAPPGADFNETYRDTLLWVIDHNGPNRTGEGFDVNWNLLNMSELTEIDSGLAIDVQNDTWAELTAFQAQQINALYNDTGAANVNSYFVRFAVNVSEVTNTLGGGSEWVCSLAGLSTATPVGAAGLGLGAAGSWVGLELVVNVDDTRYLLRMGERFGAGVVHDLVNTGWLTEGINQILYIEYLYRTGAGLVNYTSVNIFTDPEFTSGLFSRTYQLTVAQPPFRYPQIIASTGPGSLAFLNQGDQFTFLDMPLADNETWIVTYPNGTQIGNCTEYECAIVLADDELGPDPRDPDPPSQGWDETGPFTRFNVRFYILALGMGLFWGPLMVFAYKRPTGYEFVIGAFIMLVGVAFLISAGSV
jgi:hypothetical protein